jgi:hypothetical protein
VGTDGLALVILSDAGADPLPTCHFVLADQVLAVDHHLGHVYGVALAPCGDPAGTADAWLTKVADQLAALKQTEPPPTPPCEYAVHLTP